MEHYDTVQEKCPACNGASRINHNGNMFLCSRCTGHGTISVKVLRDTCQQCKGFGTVDDPTKPSERRCNCNHGYDPGGFAEGYCDRKYTYKPQMACPLCKGAKSFAPGTHPKPVMGVVGWHTP